ncbi:hypothetical protein [Glycomyces harbinensis]|uniref:DUF1963 domain-containing protein n=1 Tax=Glycomyces harbinensis TaxID=58114 RepID=A0A1G6SGC0_9ACTN|nr:hypothetical protein [Glycomyces harbinensis]SDD15929.1 hypothetical protein SAMN05216270_10286 [Glycomyces harbinensis]
MPFTTPPRPVDVAAFWPELATLARTAVRLHPRRGEPTAYQSSIGGPLLWPESEPWPTCDGAHEWDVLATLDEVAAYRRTIARAWSPDGAGPPHFTTEDRTLLDLLNEIQSDRTRRTGLQAEPAALLPVAQLFTRDVPGLPLGNRFDLLQVLWCPYDHAEEYQPAVHLRWRNTADQPMTAALPPADTLVGFADYVPNPCTVAPEPVTEYPDFGLLPPDLAGRIEAHERVTDDFGYRELALAPGWKANGHGTMWMLIDAFDVRCECGAEAKPLLTAATRRWGSSNPLWMPLEDGDRVEDAVEIVIGRGADLQIFHCGTDPAHAPVTVIV